jgi:hypothetical protein
VHRGLLKIVQPEATIEAGGAAVAHPAADQGATARSGSLCMGMPPRVLLKAAVLEQPVGSRFLGAAAGQQLAVVSTCNRTRLHASSLPTHLPTAVHSVLDMWELSDIVQLMQD